jgi:hypothetical protein
MVGIKKTTNTRKRGNQARTDELVGCWFGENKGWVVAGFQSLYLLGFS